MNNDLKSSIQNAMRKNKDTPTFDSTQDNEQEKTETAGQIPRESDEPVEPVEPVKPVEGKKIADRPLITFGAFCLALFVLAIIFYPSTSVNESEAAKQALTDKTSTSLAAGAVLLNEDENLGAQDYTITHQSSNDETKIWVWDYAAEDGDYVQALVNQAPVGDAFMIKHQPVELMVPAVGTVQVKGIRDGGGGITYAVRYDLNSTTYFNTAPEGEFNTYTLIRE